MSDLSEFFRAVSREKKKNESEFQALISDSTSKKSNLIESSLGLLAEPTQTKNSDSLTPLNQKFLTQEDFQNHYRLFLARVQQQLSTLGGGGEVNLAFMDVPQTYVTSSSYTASESDYYIGVNYSGAVNILLPTPSRNGKIYVIKDELGQASNGINRQITVSSLNSDLFDNQDKAILAYDYGSLTLIYRNGWRII